MTRSLAFLLLLGACADKADTGPLPGTTDDTGPCKQETWYIDQDGDGYGTPDSTLEACVQPDGYAINPGDCDDATSGSHPGADETCSDGLDDDCDEQVDCEDSDCSSNSACLEDCWDGADNDSDGLTDCEDADCYGADGCAEICNDHGDNDGDGLTDCDDDDCIDRCVVVSARTGSGAMSITRKLFTSSVIEGSPSSFQASFIRREGWSGSATGVWGTVQWAPLDDTAAGSTCSWSLDTATLGHRFTWIGGSSGAGETGIWGGSHQAPGRDGFAFDSDCILNLGETILPSSLWLHSGGAAGGMGASGVLTLQSPSWYQGQVLHSGQTSSTGGSGGTALRYFTSSWSIQLGQGDVWTQTLPTAP